MLRLDRLRLFMIDVQLKAEKQRCFREAKILYKTVVVVKLDLKESRPIFCCYFCNNMLLETLTFLTQVK